MHQTQKDFCDYIKEKFPAYFSNSQVLEIGSLDVNGNNKYLFDKCSYTGIDVIEGKNVDLVSIAHEFETDKKYDVILSTNALEHDRYKTLTLAKMYFLLKNNGLLFFSAAAAWKEHGTLKRATADSGTSKIKGWETFYENISENYLKSIFDFPGLFKEYKIELCKKDIRFWGVKID
jgi:SAM-dependent methyltransferase